MSNLETTSSDALRYFALNCTLKKSPAASSTDRLLGRITTRLEALGAAGSTERVVDHAVHFRVTSDEGDGDEWPHTTDDKDVSPAPEQTVH